MVTCPSAAARTESLAAKRCVSKFINPNLKQVRIAFIIRFRYNSMCTVYYDGVSINVCTYIRVYGSTYECVCISSSIFVCMYIYVCMRMCMYT